MSYYSKSDLENILGCSVEEIQVILDDEPARPGTSAQGEMGCLLLTLFLGIPFLCILTDMIL